MLGKASLSRLSTKMNQTEQAYANHLKMLYLGGHILKFDFEPEKLRLADNTYYTPDFRVVNREGMIEFHEVKGFWRDDARVKIKVAAEMHPYKFVGIIKKKGSWIYENF